MQCKQSCKCDAQMKACACACKGPEVAGSVLHLVHQVLEWMRGLDLLVAPLLVLLQKLSL